MQESVSKCQNYKSSNIPSSFNSNGCIENKIRFKRETNDLLLTVLEKQSAESYINGFTLKDIT